MASLFRRTYSKPIPPGAEERTNKGTREVRLVIDGKAAWCPVTKKGDRARVRASKWYGQHLDGDGVLQRVALSENKEVAKQMLAELVRGTQLGKVGLRDPFDKHRKTPLASHPTDWERSLRDAGVTDHHATTTVRCARAVIEGAGFVFFPDLSASKAMAFLAELKGARGKGVGEIDPEKEEFRRDEVAAVLGVTPFAIPPLVRRHQLAATGNGKRRRYPRATVEALARLKLRGKSVRSSNQYLAAVKQFCNWMVADRRMPDNPLQHLEGGNVNADRRHDRRALSADELRAVIRAAQASGAVVRGLTGAERAVLYSVACVSGFRAEELSTVTPADFDLDGEPPVVRLGCAESKNREGAVQPLPPDAVSALRALLAGRDRDRPVWPGKWFRKAADMLRVDLDAANVPYSIDGPNGPLFADFHALRHSFVLLLDQSGASLKEAMQLARHSDPKLTMARYGRARLHDLGAAVDRLPPLIEEAGKEGEGENRTGTGG